MATLLAGTVYQRGVSKQGESSNTCYGSGCFRLTFIVISVLAGLAVILSLVLWQRTRKTYAAVIEQQVSERQRRGIRVRLLATSQFQCVCCSPLF